MTLEEKLEEIIRRVVREELEHGSALEIEKLLTADQVAEYVGCGKQAVYRLRREGHLAAVMISETQMGFAPEEVRRFIRAGGIKALPQKQDAA